MNHYHTPLKGIKNNILLTGILCMGLVSCGQMPVLGQFSTLPGEERMNGKGVEAAFEAQRAVLQQSSAAIYRGRKPIGYGVIMSKDGYILTKRSELFIFDTKSKASKFKDNLKIIIDKDRYNQVTLEASDIKWDLAILKVNTEGKDLKPVKWARFSEIEQGSWVITNGSTSKRRRRLNVGIISAKAREIKGDLPVILGIGLKARKDNSGIEITRVLENSGAMEADMLVGDLIKKFDKIKVTKQDQIIDIIREKQPGDYVEVEFLRKEKLLKQKMELRPRKEIQGENKTPLNRNDQMSGEFSQRRNSFPMVLQHDIDQKPRHTGGPLLNLSGEAIGINIARANRAESFAIPSKEAQIVYQQMLDSISK